MDKERRIERLTALVEGYKRNSIELSKMYHERIKELEASQIKWISVDERLPKECEPVLWYSEEYEVYIEGYLATINGKTFITTTYDDVMNYYENSGLTHWMLLPPPPTTEKPTADIKENLITEQTNKSEV